jgi:CRP/FNR family cyclic AMP-dependent transcriptional regulator
MGSFKAVFRITEINNCPLYKLSERIVLTEKALTFPKDRESCLILVREMTQLLFQLLDEDDAAAGEGSRVYTCSGCTGLIKFVRVEPDEGQGPLPGCPLTAEHERILAKISASALVKAFPGELVGKFIQCLTVRIIPAGAFLIKKGESNEDLYIILSGEVSIEDENIKITTLREGDVCGEMSYFGNKIARSSVRAIRPTRIASISGDDFGRFMSEAASVQLFMARLLAERLATANTVRMREFDACMQGRIKEMAPAELFQIFHMHQKTGSLVLELSMGTGRVSFREGCIINAAYAGLENQDAIFSILAEKEGLYRFTVGLTPQEMKSAEIGDFMMLLMEGVRRVDEENEAEDAL